MLIVSQNLTNFDLTLPENTIYRINLAWISDLETLKNILKKHENHPIFLDLPKNRTKPPNNKYSMDEISPILEEFSNIKFFAISNIDSKNDLLEFLRPVSRDIIIVPKIESPTSVKNIKEITDLLGPEKIIMLDHDDLYSSLLRSNEKPENFQHYIKSLIEFCDANDVTLLRTIGVMFGDTEKRISDYVK